MRKLYGVIAAGRLVDVTHAARALRRRWPTRPIHRLERIDDRHFKAIEVVAPGEFASDAAHALKKNGKTYETGALPCVS